MLLIICGQHLGHNWFRFMEIKQIEPKLSRIRATSELIFGEPAALLFLQH
jgi:hypothetical protein